jgi:hypothetical protein
MHRRSLVTCLAVLAANILSAACAYQSLAAGYWNVPGTFAQRAGHGYGGGYHAPLLLGPVCCDGWHLGTPTRLPCAPTPYYGCGECGDYGRMVEAPSSLDGAVSTTMPAQGPAAATPAAADVRPVEPAVVTTPEASSPEPETVIESAPEPVSQPKKPLFPAPM